MKVKRKSPFTGVEREIELPISQEQYDAWRAGALIQKVMPHLTPDQREFLISGVTKEEWEERFKNLD